VLFAQLLSSYVLAEKALLYEKCASKMLMKLTPVCNDLCFKNWNFEKKLLVKLRPDSPLRIPIVYLPNSIDKMSRNSNLLLNREWVEPKSSQSCPWKKDDFNSNFNSFFLLSRISSSLFYYHIKSKCHQIRHGGGGLKRLKKSVTYYLNGPLTHRQGRLQPRVTDFKGPQKCFESLKNIS